MEWIMTCAGMKVIAMYANIFVNAINATNLNVESSDAVVVNVV